MQVADHVDGRNRAADLAKATIRGLIVLTLLTISACTQAAGNPKARSASTVRPSCARDEDCVGGFCDRGTCASLQLEPAPGFYGVACAPPPLSADGRPDLTNYRCGAYLCLQSRCRSCSADSECRDALGAPTCGVGEGRSGRMCGD